MADQDDKSRQGQQGDPDTGAETSSARDESTDWKAEAAKWKAHARKHEDLWKASGHKPEDLKELVAASKRLKETEEADKSDLQRAIERADASDRTAAETQGKYLRLSVAYEKGLPRDLADRLRGETEEEMSEDADRLLELFEKRAPAEDLPRRPQERFRPGAAPDNAKPLEMDPEKLAAMVPRR